MVVRGGSGRGGGDGDGGVGVGGGSGDVAFAVVGGGVVGCWSWC